ncbi:MAG: hypothetical protein DHS20C15_01390 [Planctomycetota bacterium]|nr:MAG: hypothetical protein DHS20C15_01390 [Planctomycetota bacterium]
MHDAAERSALVGSNPAKEQRVSGGEISIGDAYDAGVSAPASPTPDESLPPSRVDYESNDLDRGEYVTAVVHLYRGEVARANTWRMRLDHSTHWAIFSTASALGFAFGDVEASHFSLQFANALLVVLLSLEARRFRFFDVWRARVRKIETNFFAPILERDLRSPEASWAQLVADDLVTPHFHVTRMQALRLRMARNYLAIFAIIFAAWVIKLYIHPTPAASLREIVERCAVGGLPGEFALSAIAIFYCGLLAILVIGRTHSRRSRDNWDIGDVVDEEAPQRR